MAMTGERKRIIAGMVAGFTVTAPFWLRLYFWWLGQ